MHNVDNSPRSAHARQSLPDSDDWALRVDLAALYQLLHLKNLGDRIFTHHSARLPGDSDRILLNPFGLHLDEVTATKLIRIGRDGSTVEDESFEANKAAAIIHWAVYDARPDIYCIIHHHAPECVAVASMKCGLLPLTQVGMQFHNRIGYHAYEGLSFDSDEKSRLATDLGRHNVLMLKNHGVLVCGSSVSEAYVRADDLQNTCATQMLAMSAGVELELPKPEVCEHTARQFEALPSPRGALDDWPALLRLLARHRIDYSN